MPAILNRGPRPRTVGTNQHEVHIWLYRLGTLDGLPDRMLQYLSDDEREKAREYVHEKDRRRAIVSRGVLRHIIGRLVGQPAQAIRFRHGENGKPAIDGLPDARSIDYNVSHSGDLVAWAVTRSGSVGIDIERIRPLQDAGGVARAILSNHEHTYYRSLPCSQQRTALFQAWTRKEAFLKAGGAVDIDPRCIELLLPPWELNDDGSPPHRTGTFSVSDLHMPAEYAGALACTSIDPRITMEWWGSGVGFGA
jgi:4'-phosphopantetheinyl transferase